MYHLPNLQIRITTLACYPCDCFCAFHGVQWELIGLQLQTSLGSNSWHQVGFSSKDFGGSCPSCSEIRAGTKIIVIVSFYINEIGLQDCIASFNVDDYQRVIPGAELFIIHIQVIAVQLVL